MKKIFILGLNSFSGSYFADYASNKGYIVFGCYRTPKKKILLPYETGIKKIKKYKINFDSNNDINKLIKILIIFIFNSKFQIKISIFDFLLERYVSVVLFF